MYTIYVHIYIYMDFNVTGLVLLGKSEPETINFLFATAGFCCKSSIIQFRDDFHGLRNPDGLASTFFFGFIVTFWNEIMGSEMGCTSSLSVVAVA